MRPDAIRAWLNARPFQPFRFWVLEQTEFEVRHPELLILTASTAELRFPSGSLPGQLDERLVSVALLHITRIESLPRSPAGNGAPSA
jgi:hypothetical protein